MKVKASDFFRRQEIAQAQVYHNGSCDLCGSKTALEYHEIFPRSLTMGNEDARMISYKKELCAFLCRTCHDLAQTNSDLGALLLVMNMRRYGVEKVLEAQAMLIESMTSSLNALITDDPNATIALNIDSYKFLEDQLGKEN